MSYHAVFAKGNGIVSSRRNPTKPKVAKKPKKFVSRLYDINRKAYPIESIPPTNN